MLTKINVVSLRTSPDKIQVTRLSIFGDLTLVSGDTIFGRLDRIPNFHFIVTVFSVPSCVQCYVPQQWTIVTYPPIKVEG